jgi:hypothetical protein
MKNKTPQPKSTKYQELCNAFVKAQDEFKQFSEDCLQFGETLIASLIRYYRVPKKRVHFFEPDEEGDLQLAKKPLEEVMFLRDDAWWQLSIGITLSEAEEVSTLETVILEILFRRDSQGHYIVKLHGERESFQIDRTQKQPFAPFFDYLHEKIVVSYSTGLQTFIDQPKTIRNIGFQYGRKTK